MTGFCGVNHFELHRHSCCSMDCPAATVTGDVGSAIAPTRRLSTTSSSALSRAAQATQSKTRESLSDSSQTWGQLHTLRELYKQEFITEEEYKERSAQLIDELTGTVGASLSKIPSVQLKKNVREPPDFSQIKPEAAIRHYFDTNTHTWKSEKVTVHLDSKPFAVGGLRRAHYIKLLREKKDEGCDEPEDDDLEEELFVAKMARHESEDKATYFQDVEIQLYAKEWSIKYNSKNPPKRVDFVKACILELTARPDNPICGIERYIKGKYRKHNNNFGYVSQDERNTPQAFSHFTYHESNGTMLVCDIQGVGDLYTDPQIHSVNMEWFGKGNLGPKGFERFLSTHKCNAICRYLNLPLINAKPLQEDLGTMPQTRYNYQHVDVMNVHVSPRPSVSSPRAVKKAPPRKVQPTIKTPLLDRINNGKGLEPQNRTCCCAIS